MNDEQQFTLYGALAQITVLHSFVRALLETHPNPAQMLAKVEPKIAAFPEVLQQWPVSDYEAKIATQAAHELLDCLR